MTVKIKKSPAFVLEDIKEWEENGLFEHTLPSLQDQRIKALSQAMTDDLDRQILEEIGIIMVESEERASRDMARLCEI